MESPAQSATHGATPRLGSVALGLSLAAAALGAVGLLGWHLRETLWIRAGSQLPPMQYNTALAMFLCGLGLCAVQRGWTRVSLGLAASAGAIGAATALEYLLGIDLGIDQLLMRHDVALDSAHAGRMAPNTAIAFVLAAGALALLSRLPLLAPAASASGAAGVVIAMSLASLQSFLVPTRLYGWGALTGMARHTSLGFALLGAGVIATNHSRVPALRSRLGWMPLLGTLGAAALAAGTWQGYELRQLASLRELSLHASEHARRAIEAAVYRTREQLAPLHAAAESADERAWSTHSARALQTTHGLRALVWVDPHGEIRATAFAKQVPSGSTETALREAARRGPIALQRAVAGPSQIALSLAGPPEASAGDSLVFALDLDQVLGWSAPLEVAPFALQVRWRDRLTLSRPSSEHSRGAMPMVPSSYQVAVETDLGDSALSLTSWPLPPMVDAVRSTGLGVLLGGLLLAMLGGLALHLWRWNQWQAAQHRARVEQHALLLDCLSEGVVGAGPDGEFLFFNRTAEQILGQGALRVRPDVWSRAYKLYEPDGETEYPPAELPLARALRGESCDQVQLCFRTPESDELRTLSASARPLRDQGRVIGGVVVFRDVTESVNQKRMRGQLEVQVMESQKLESIGQLAAGVAHEINTPAQFVRDNLTFLSHASTQLLDLIAHYQRALAARPDASEAARIKELEREVELDELAQEFPEALSQSLDGIGRIAKIVASLKEFAHPGSPDKKPADLNRAVRSALVVATNEWRYVADLEEDLDPSLPTVPCVVSEISQVVLNLVVNAAQALAGSEPVRAGGKGRITVRTRAESEGVVLEIADDGPGIPEALQQKIFEPFFTTKPVGKGTGQGLALVQRIVVRTHGGSIDIASEPRRGTRFRIWLPLSAHEG